MKESVQLLCDLFGEKQHWAVRMDALHVGPDDLLDLRRRNLNYGRWRRFVFATTELQQIDRKFLFLVNPHIRPNHRKKSPCGFDALPRTLVGIRNLDVKRIAAQRALSRSDRSVSSRVDKYSGPEQEFGSVLLRFFFTPIVNGGR
jgi:hypothetical protein